MSESMRTLIEELLRSREVQNQILTALSSPGQSQAVLANSGTSTALIRNSSSMLSEAGPSGLQRRPAVGTVETEMSRIFRGHSTPKRPRRALSTSDSSCVNDVYLAYGPECNATYRGTMKVDAYNKGLIISSVRIMRHWTYTQVCHQMRQLFPSFLPPHIELEFLLPVQGSLVAPILHNAQLDGFHIKKVFACKPIYIRPSQTIVNLLDDQSDLQNGSSETGAAHIHTTSMIFNVDSDDEEGEMEKLHNNNKSEMETLYNNNRSDDNSTSEVISVITLNDILQNLQIQITEDISQFNVYRDDIFYCCVRAMRRKSFSPFNKISVKFSDIDGNSEGAVDIGGPTREMFRLALNYIGNSKLFTGNEKKNISLERVALEKKDYFEAGRLISLSLVHGGPGPHFFSDTLFSAIVIGIEKTTPSLQDVNEDVRQKILKVINCDNLLELQGIILEDSIFTFAGCNSIKNLQEKQNIIDDILKFYVLHRTRPALEQFIEGLQTCNIYNLMVEYATIFKDLMCSESVPLTADGMEKLFKVTLSEVGSNKRKIENRLLAFWRDYLQDCEEGTIETTLEDVLSFITGANKIPPLGFEIEPTIHFLHDTDNNTFPKANTCALQMYLPTSHSTYEEFRDKVDYGIREGMNFAFA